MRSLLRESSGTPSDADLVAAACGGDASALGVLLERHRPRLFASAIRLLGYRAEAEDAVQETCLIALRYMASLRDADAVGAWLHMVLRRVCLQHRRRQRRESVVGDSLDGLIAAESSIGNHIEDRIERLELRDWIWSALDRLPEALRVSAMLRYFGSYDSYDEVAAILGVPIGTVRSRLSEVRTKLADALLASAGRIDDDARVRSSERRRFWMGAFDDIFRRGDSHRFVSHFATDLVVGWSNGKHARGREYLAAEIDGDLAAGVRIDLERVMTHGGIAVVEGRFVNPPEAPDHCPPGIALVLLGRDERTTSIRLHLATRMPKPEID
jgi:RNA polymerase sigma factor (sigma-70 family)